MNTGYLVKDGIVTAHLHGVKGTPEHPGEQFVPCAADRLPDVGGPPVSPKTDVEKILEVLLERGRIDRADYTAAMKAL